MNCADLFKVSVEEVYGLVQEVDRKLQEFKERSAELHKKLREKSRAREERELEVCIVTLFMKQCKNEYFLMLYFFSVQK